MESSTAHTIVKIISVLDYIGAAFAILMGLLFLIIGSAFTAFLGPFGALGALAGIIFIVLGVVQGFIAYGLWNFRNWARIITIVFLCIGALFCIASIVQGNITSGIISLVIEGLFLWFFAIEKSTIMLFKSAQKG